LGPRVVVAKEGRCEMNGTRSTTTGTADGTLNASSLAPMLVDKLEAARLLGVSPGTVNNLISRGQLGSIKIGTRRLIERAEILAFIERNKEVRG
jgi:excisionase family DNA binding protein